jgi:integrase
LDVANHSKRLLTDDEVRAMIKAASPYRRDFLLLKLLAVTGMRIQELLLTKTKWVNLKDRTIYVPEENAKNGEEAVKLFNDDTAPYLAQWMVENKFRPDDRIFDLSTRQASRIVKGYAREAGIPDWKDISPHYFRHWYGTRWWIKYSDPVLAARMMSQKSLQLTYLHNVTDDQKRKYDEVMRGT